MHVHHLELSVKTSSCVNWHKNKSFEWPGLRASLIGNQGLVNRMRSIESRIALCRACIRCLDTKTSGHKQSLQARSCTAWNTCTKKSLCPFQSWSTICTLCFAVAEQIHYCLMLGKTQAVWNTWFCLGLLEQTHTAQKVLFVMVWTASRKQDPELN